MNASRSDAIVRARQIPVGSLVLHRSTPDASLLSRTRSIVFAALGRRWVHVDGLRKALRVDRLQVLDDVPEGREAELVRCYLSAEPRSTLVLHGVYVPELSRARLLGALRELEARGEALRTGATGLLWKRGVPCT